MKSFKELLNIGVRNKMEKYKEWYFIILLSFCIFLFGYNEYLNVALIVFISVIISRVDIGKLLCAYIYLYFFKDIIKLEFIYSLTRVVIGPIIAIRLIKYIIKNKTYPTRNEIVIFTFFMISSIISILTKGISKVMFYIDMEVTIILMFSMVIKHKYNKEEIRKIIKNIFLTIVIACFNIIVWGCLNNNFMLESRGQELFIRFRGIQDPNYTALFLNLGIVSIIFLKDILKTKNKIVLLIIYILALLFTQSTTGLICFGIIIMLFLIKKIKNIKLIIKSTSIKNKIIFAIILIFVIGFIIYNYEFFNNKTIYILEKIKNGDIDSATSGRISIINSFINEFNHSKLINKMFGTGPQPLLVYSERFKALRYSHNSYIDLFTCFGVIGGIVSLIYIINKMKESKFLDINEPQEYKDLIFFSRLVILMFGLGFTFHSELITLMLFLL